LPNALSSSDIDASPVARSLTVDASLIRSPRGITAAEWEAFLDDLQQTLDKFAVPQAEQEQRSRLSLPAREPILSFKLAGATPAQARDAQQPTRCFYRWLTEVFKTRDLKEAKALLEELAS
jgi:hypothetical protein